MAGMDKFTAEMKKELDLTEKQIATTRQKSPDTWKRRALYNMSEAAQERISSSSDRDLKSDVDIASPSRRQKLRERRWLENRRSGSVMSQSSDSTRYRLQNQGNEVQSRPNERKSNTSVLGQLKGGGGETSEQPEDESSEQERPRADLAPLLKKVQDSLYPERGEPSTDLAPLLKKLQDSN
jgi:hypothetical protein